MCIRDSNKGDIPTFANKRCSSFIDVTISNNLKTDILDWNVSTEYNGSDHNTIHFDLELETEIVGPVWLWKKAKWNVFTDKLKNFNPEYDEILNARKIEIRLQKLYEALNEAKQLSAVVRRIVNSWIFRS